MRTLNYTTFRRKLSETMESICHESESVIITKGSSCSVVMLPLEDYSSLMETDYLLRNPNNSAWLQASIASARVGKTKNIAVEKGDQNGVLHAFLHGTGGT